MRRIFATCLLIAAAAGAYSPANAQAMLFEGARLIAGDGSTPIENSAFLVENTQFTRVGRRGQIPLPAGGKRVDLTGKTVIPAKVDLHGHFGYQHDWDGTMSKEYFTRENLVDRSDLRGGRTGWGNVPLTGRDRHKDQPRCRAVSHGGSGDRLAGIGR